MIWPRAGVLAFGDDLRRLRPNVVVRGRHGFGRARLATEPGRRGDAIIAMADLRERCLMKTSDLDSLAAQGVLARVDYAARR